MSLRQGVSQNCRDAIVQFKSFTFGRDGYDEIVKKHYPETAPIAQVDKYDFYDQTRKAFAVVMTGDTRIYANLILAKGVTTW